VRGAYARLYVEIAAREGPTLFFGRTEAFGVLRAEEGNLRAAQAWLHEHEDAHGLSMLAASLWQFWGALGQQREHLTWIDGLLDAGGLDAGDHVRLALAGAAMHLQLGASDRGERLMNEAEALLRHADDSRAGDDMKVRDPFAAAAAVALPLGRSFVAAARHDFRAATVAASTAHTRALEAGSSWAAAMASLMLARVALAQQRLEEALDHAGSAIGELASDRGSLAWAHMSVAVIQAVAAHPVAARASAAEALGVFADMGYGEGTTMALATAAFVAAKVGDDARAVRLAAAAERARAVVGTAASEPEASIVAAELAALRARAGAGWQMLWDEGLAMPLDVAVRYGMAGTDPAGGDRVE
jgi:hypothetical protein